MRGRRLLCVVAMSLGTLFIAAGGNSAHAQVREGLLRRIPMGANALVVIDADAVYQSPLAQKEQWKQNYSTNYVKQPLILPPEARNLVLGAQLDPEQGLKSVWELAVMELNEDIPMRSIARAEGGYVDTVNSLEAAWTPSNTYFVQLADKTLGMVYPDNRQFVSRWADYGLTNSETRISQYLQTAAQTVGKNGEIVLAVDLRDIVQPHNLSETIENSPILKDKKFNGDELTKAIMSIQGLTLAIDIENTVNGTLSIQFGQDVSVLSPFAKDLVLAALNKAGASLSDLNDWKADVNYDTITMKGKLSTEGFRRVMSLLEIPTTKFSTLRDQTQEGAPAETSQDTVVKASKSYFNGVQTLVDDLRKTLKDTEDNHAVWMERYARKVDALPILNVDDELLAFGANVGSTFRDMSMAKRGAGIRTGVRNSETYGNYYYGGYANNFNYGYSYRDPSSERIQIKREENAQASKVKFQSFENIDNELARLRQEMTKKYGTEF